jgi:hypothetical protein
MKSIAMLLATASVVTATGAHGANADLSERVRACARIEEGTRRLACYDREVSTPATDATTSGASTRPVPAAPAVPAIPAARPTPVSPPAPAPVAAPRAPEQDFGATGSEVARKREQQRKEEGDHLEEITAKVTKVVTQARGELVITLDNGHTWRQKRAEAYFPLAVGDTVRIRAGTLGSFRLSNPAGRQTQVTRVE